MRAVERFVLVVLALALTTGCKRDTVPSSSSSAPAGNASATGPGAVSVNGNVVTFQNVRIEVPWDVSDVAGVVKMSQEAARGAGLKLSDGKNTLLVASDGRSIQLNGQPCGALKAGDNVQLTKEGKLIVNGIERHPDEPTKKSAN